MRILNTTTVTPYTWQGTCTAWPLVDTAHTSIKHEHMPAGSAEVPHIHEKTHQVFFVLSGQLVLDIDGQDITLSHHDAVEIPPRTPHQAKTTHDADATFLVISTPSDPTDRTDLT